MNQNNNSSKQAARIYIPIQLIPVCNLSPRLQHTTGPLHSAAMNNYNLPPLPSHLAPPMLAASTSTNTLNRAQNMSRHQFDNNMAHHNLQHIIFGSNANNTNSVELALPKLAPSITNITASNLPRSDRMDSPDSVSTLNTFTTTASQNSPNHLYQCKLKQHEIASFNINNQNMQTNHQNNNHNVHHLQNLQRHLPMNINLNDQHHANRQIMRILTTHARSNGASEFRTYNSDRNIFKEEEENDENDARNTQQTSCNPVTHGNPSNGDDQGGTERSRVDESRNTEHAENNHHADDVDEGMKNETSDHDEYDADPDYQIEDDEEQAAAAEYDDDDDEDEDNELGMYTRSKSKKQKKKSCGGKSSKTKTKKTSKHSAKPKKSASSTTSSGNVVRAVYDASSMRPIPTGPFSVKYEDICEEYIICDLCGRSFDESNGARVAYIEHYKKHCEKDEMRDYLRCVKPGCPRYGKKSKHISNFISHLTTEKHNEYTKGPFICKVYLLNENSNEWEKCGHSSTTEANLCKHVYDTHYKHTFDPHKEYRFNKRYGWHRVAWAEAERHRKQSEPSTKSKKSKKTKSSNKNKRKRKRADMPSDEDDEEYVVEDAAELEYNDEAASYRTEESYVAEAPETKRRRVFVHSNLNAAQMMMKSDDKEEADEEDVEMDARAHAPNDDDGTKAIVYDTMSTTANVCNYINNDHDADDRKYRLMPESQGRQALDFRTQFSFLAQLCVAESLLDKEF